MCTPSSDFNSRMDTLQAVVLRAKLRRLADWNERRRRAAENYHELLAGMDDIVLPWTAPYNLHVWHLYVYRCPGETISLMCFASVACRQESTILCRCICNLHSGARSTVREIFPSPRQRQAVSFPCRCILILSGPATRGCGCSPRGAKGMKRTVTTGIRNFRNGSERARSDSKVFEYKHGRFTTSV